MKEHYFVVRARLNDEGKPEFVIASDMEDARFPEGTVWNEETQQWEKWLHDDNTAGNDGLLMLALSERIEQTMEDNLQ